ncbi:MAG: M60 family metallopeptidase [Akkermansia sp.]
MNLNPFYYVPIVALAASALYAGDLDLFANPMATKLKAGVTAEQVKAMDNPVLRKAAKKMLGNKYNKKYRCAVFPAMHNPAALGEELSIGEGYSFYQGVTGVILDQGENVVIVDGIPDGVEAAIVVPDWMRRPADESKPTEDPNGWSLKKKAYPIKNGVNKLNIEKEGLAYVIYFFDDIKDKPALKIHFVNAKVNGYFDGRKQSNEEWNKLLDNAKYPIMDAIGKYIQVGYPVEAFKKYSYGKGVELIKSYDDMLQAQYDLMGWTKYNRIPKNRLLSRVNFNYYMFRDNDGVAYMGGPGYLYAMGLVTDPAVVTKGDPCWGFNHEVGHAHQLYPHFKWGGMTEVSNNMCSLYVNILFGSESRLKEGKCYDKARKEIIESGQGLLECPNVMSRLVPFWQLQLYFTREGYKDFYPDLYECFRRQNDVLTMEQRQKHSKNPAVHQLNFVKQACTIGKTDLTDFFDKWGFFKVGEWEVKDYGTYHYAMSQEMVDACKAEIKAMNLPKPAYDPSSCED